MKNSKKFLALTLALIVMAALTVPAFAATLRKKTIDVYSGITVYIDGVKVTPRDATGAEVDVFSYNGTTYLPIRAISEALGFNVTWDSSTSSVYVGEVPGQRQYLIDVCPPYQTEEYEEPAIITIAGKKYTHGFKFLGSFFTSGFYALYNLNGQFSTFEFDVGHIDGQRMRDEVLNIYLDGTIVFTMELTGEMMPTHCYIPLDGALQMKIELGYGGDVYGFVNAEIY